MLASSVLRLREQKAMWLVGFGHGTTHWIMATFFIVLPFVTQDLGLSYAQAGILASSFYAAAFLCNFFAGAIVDMTGRKVLFQVISLVSGAAAMVGFALSENFVFLCLMIGIVGASNNLWHPPALSFLSETYPSSRGYALSVHIVFASIADAAAPLVAGMFLALIAWQGTSALSALPALVAAALLTMQFSSSSSRSREVPAGLAAGEYLTGLVELLRNRAAVGLALMSGFRSMTQAGLLIFVPLYLVNDLAMTPVFVGVTLMLMQLGGLVAGPLAGIMSDRIGRRPIVMVCLSLTTIVIVFISIIGNATLIVAGVSVLGFALFAVRPVIQSWLLDLVPPKLGASATSVLFGSQSVLSMISPLIGGVIADAYGLVSVFYFLAATMMIANLLVFVLPRQPAR